MGDIEDTVINQFHIQIGMMIIEGRMFKSLCTATTKGNHCPVLNQIRNDHVCDEESIECQKAKSQQQRIVKYWKRNETLTIDVAMAPDCVHHNHGYLLERWRIEKTTKQSGPIVRLGLLQAINSTLYFSQLSSWRASTGLKNQSVQYRISSETSTKAFASPPQKHIFPACENVQVTLFSLPRQNEVPEVTCPECFDIDQMLERGRRLYPGHLTLSRNSSVSSNASSTQSLFRGSDVDSKSRRSSKDEDMNMLLSFESSKFSSLNNDSGFVDGELMLSSNDMESFSDSDGSMDDYIIDGPLWSPCLSTTNIVASPTDRRLQSLQQRYQDNFPRRPSLDRVLSQRTQGTRSRHSSLDSAISNFAHLELKNENLAQIPNSPLTGFSHDDDDRSLVNAKKSKQYNLKLPMPSACEEAMHIARAKNDFASDKDLSTYTLDKNSYSKTLNHKDTVLDDYIFGKQDSYKRSKDEKITPCSRLDVINLSVEKDENNNNCAISVNENFEANEKAQLDERSSVPPLSMLEMPTLKPSNLLDRESILLRSPPNKLRVLNEDVYGKYGRISPRIPVHKAANCIQFPPDKHQSFLCNSSKSASTPPCSPRSSNMIYEFEAKMPSEVRSSRSKCKGKCMKKNGHVALNFCKPKPFNRLLGNFEESILHSRLPELGTVEGFNIQLGASGSFCPEKIRMPLTVKFFDVSIDNAPSPYLGTASLKKHIRGKRGYHIPNKGTLQMTLFNTNESAVKMFVMLYDVSDMPPSHRTFVRHRIHSVPVERSDLTSSSSKSPKYCVNLWIESSKTNKIYIYGEIKVLFSLASSDWDSGNTFELKSETVLPFNPKYSPKK